MSKAFEALGKLTALIILYYIGVSFVWLIVIILLWVIYDELNRDHDNGTYSAMRRGMEMSSYHAKNMSGNVHNSQFQNSEWFNKILENIWRFINKDLSSFLKNAIETRTLDYLGPFRKLGFKFEEFDVGNNPIQFRDVYVHDNRQQQSTKNLIVDFNILYCGDCNISYYLGYLNGQIKDLQIRGTLQAEINMHNLSWQVYFVNTPIVDFTIAGFFCFLDAPFIRGYFRRTIDSAIAGLMVLPNKLSPFDEPTEQISCIPAEAEEDDLLDLREGEEVDNNPVSSSCRSRDNSVVSFHHIFARNNSHGSMLLNVSRDQSQESRETLNITPDFMASGMATLATYSRPLDGNGRAPLFARNSSVSSQTKNAGRGCIKLALGYSTETNTLKITVHQAVNLFSMEFIPSPYVKLYLYSNISEHSKMKTETVNYKVNPEYNETFDYTMTEENVKNSYLKVAVKTKRYYVYSYVLGQVILELRPFVFPISTTLWCYLLPELYT